MKYDGMPTLYLNENVAFQVKDILLEKNINSIHTLDVGNIGISDELQLEYASKNKYILVTHNRKDFRKLHKNWIEAKKKHSGILVLRHAEDFIVAYRLFLFIRDIYPNLNSPFCLSPPPHN